MYKLIHLTLICCGVELINNTKENGLLTYEQDYKINLPQVINAAQPTDLPPKKLRKKPLDCVDLKKRKDSFLIRQKENGINISDEEKIETAYDNDDYYHPPTRVYFLRNSNSELRSKSKNNRNNTSRSCCCEPLFSLSKFCDCFGLS